MNNTRPHAMAWPKLIHCLLKLRGLNHRICPAGQQRCLALLMFFLLNLSVPFVATSPPTRPARLYRRVKHNAVGRSSTSQGTKEHRGEEVRFWRGANFVLAQTISSPARDLLEGMNWTVTCCCNYRERPGRCMLLLQLQRKTWMVTCCCNYRERHRQCVL